jgi:GNS1/SUR4 family
MHSSQTRDKPYNCKRLMMAYNVINVTISLYVAAGILAHKLQHANSFSSFWGSGLVCTQLDTGPNGQHMARLFTVFFLQKFLEFADTLFFIARKSFRQVGIATFH